MQKTVRIVSLRYNPDPSGKARQQGVDLGVKLATVLACAIADDEQPQPRSHLFRQQSKGTHQIQLTFAFANGAQQNDSEFGLANAQGGARCLTIMSTSTGAQSLEVKPVINGREIMAAV